MDKVLRKDSEVSIFFQIKKGYLYGSEVFIEVINGKINDVYATKDADVSQALYLVEIEIDSLGLNLLDGVFEPAMVKEKLEEAFNIEVIEIEFDVISKGDVVEPKAILKTTNTPNKLNTLDPTDEYNKKIEEVIGGFKGAMGVPSEETDVVQVEDNSHEQIDIFNFEESEKVEDVTSLPTEEPKAEDSKESKKEFQSFREVLSKVAKEEVEEESEKTSEVTEVEEDEVAETTTAEVEVKVDVEEELVTPTKVAKVRVEKAEVFPKLFDQDDYVREYLENAFSDADESTKVRSIIRWAIEKREENRERMKGYPQEIVDQIPGEIKIIGNGKVIRKALGAMMANLPLSLKGPAGVGKTTILYTIAAILNYPLFIINGSLESNKSTLIGELTVKERGIISVKDGQMTKAAEYGGILYIDEINMMRPDVLSLVNAFNDDQRKFNNDVRGEITKLHKDTRFVSAMNVGYAGVKKMNEATSDRSVAIELGYLPKNELREVLKSVAGVGDIDYLDELSLVEVERISMIYSYMAEESKSGIVPDMATSARNVIQIAKLAPILGFQEALEMFVDKYEDEVPESIVGILSKDGLLDQLGVEATRLINRK